MTKNQTRSGVFAKLRRGLDALYTLSGLIGALFLVAILGIIVAQMAARWLGLQFPGSADYAGYCMAASSFFALAYTLNNNAHIRVSLILSRMTGLKRRLADIWCLSVSALLAGYLSYYSIRNVQMSHLIHDISQGQDATPLWIPQLSLAIGSVIFTIALVDHLVRTLAGHDHTFDDTHHVEGEEF
ncbi:TRAP transporter small permease [Marinobacterium arenosum]|uniref:TRAP transporter small permease n=1 Tax=Marinobacterium arenosum TaxID=2862496 RepID=UPI001C964255|nr:TRAP transporter small permease [Marinobacterium arenosum]MBY4677742.1 TRAP transporter small permease [Marinobacterium arenosum]